jgi:hypothetical protein
MAPPPWLPPLARWALALGLLGAVAAGASYASWASEWSRARPKVSPCFAAMKFRLRTPETTSGSEPADAGDGRTVYVTATADRAIRCARDLGPGPAQRLADAFGEIEPEARAAKLVAMLDALPKDASGDREAVALGHIVEGAIDALPRSEAVIAADRRADSIVECRFGGSACQERPGIPILTWIGGAAGAVGILVALFHVGRAAAARVVAARRRSS